MKRIVIVRLLAFVIPLAVLALMVSWRQSGGAVSDNGCFQPADIPVSAGIGDPDLFGVNTGPFVIRQQDKATRPELELAGDFSLEVDVMITDTAARDATAGIFFHDSGGESAYHFGIFPNEDRWKIYEGRTRTLLADEYLNTGLDTGRWHNLRVDVRGGYMRAAIDGNEVTGEPVRLLVDRGMAGVRMRESAAAFDNIIVRQASGATLFSDDFSAGAAGWDLETETFWSAGEDDGDGFIRGDVLLEVDELLAPPIARSLEPHMLLLAAAGARHARVFIYWDNIQAEGPDDYNWEEIDALVLVARKHGINVMLNIVYAPHWAIAPESRSDPAAKAFPPEDMSDYADFVATTVERYRAGGVLARERGWGDGYGISEYQLGHEFNAGRLEGYGRTLFAGWMGDLDQYVDMLKAGRDAVKQECPGCTVISGPATELLKPNYPAQSDPTGERQYLWQGVEDLYTTIQARHPGDPQASDRYFDVLSVNVYEWYVYSRYGQNPDRFRAYEFPDPRWYQDRIGKVAQVMGRFGDAEKEIWLTEVAFASADNGDPYRGSLDPEGQAEALEMVYRESARFEQVKRVFWWYSYDTDTYTGLFSVAMTGKPAFSTYMRISGGGSPEYGSASCLSPLASFTDSGQRRVRIENTSKNSASVLVYVDGRLCAANNIPPRGRWEFLSWGDGGGVEIVADRESGLEVDLGR